MLAAGRSDVRDPVKWMNIQFTQYFIPYKALGFTQPLTEMSTRRKKLMLLGSRSRPVRRADNLTAIWADCLDNVGFLTSQPYRPPWPVTGIATFLLFYLLNSHIVHNSIRVWVYVYYAIDDKTYLAIHTVYVSTFNLNWGWVHPVACVSQIKTVIIASFATTFNLFIEKDY
jgi:hypothetical protein